MTIPTFNPGSYTDISSHPASIRLWSFLNRDESKIKMKTASNLGRPALEAVADDLLAEFSEQFVENNPHRDRFKQMAGAMTRQVMESEGYFWVRDNVPLSGAPFSRASKYRHREAVEFHIWRLSTDIRFVGVTLEKSGKKLPRQQDGEWVYWKRVDGSLLEGKLHLSIAAGIADVSDALKGLKKHGAYATHTQRIMRAA
ncbi:hypothetical protein [Noviherbaspirillum autotrophicum]|uniref:Uncharacterized protein n=1 Tax=Noviherbaspirillum autotrophicum TaxID=709839 RepID=A0A0C2BS76_9BURK|nr:hypothetical protein [Noviherbaspirillum autotrophicum]KIF82879.1 hypothetical protein TSA66_21905 [Noviherbaspirillum autotrophicum]